MACEQVAITVVEEASEVLIKENSAKKEATGRKGRSLKRNGTYTVKNKSGTTSTFTLVNGLKEGQATQNFGNGKIWKEVTYKKGRLDGLAKVYNQAGDLVRTVNYKAGKKSGLYTRYYPSGNKKLEIEYLEDFPLPGIYQRDARGHENPGPDISVEIVESTGDNREQLKRWIIMLNGGAKLQKAYLFVEQDHYQDNITNLKPFAVEKNNSGEFSHVFKAAEGVQADLTVHLYGHYEIYGGVLACAYKEVKLQFGQ